jgi:hypothetical protein
VIWRWLLVLSALLFANSANCGSGYQYTRDGKTLIWNNSLSRGDAAAWSGRRDSAGFATGYGTLTWYKRQQAIITGSNIPSPTNGSVVLGRYSGQMVRGKFQGTVVNIDANGRVFHGTFVNGTKTSDGVEGRMAYTNPQMVQHAPNNAVNKEAAPPSVGPPPPPSNNPQSVQHAPKSAVKKEAAAPSVGPPPASNNPQLVQHAPKNAGGEEPAPPAAGPPLDEHGDEKTSGSVADTKPAFGESLHAVTPPSSLRAPVIAAIAPPASVSAPPPQPSVNPIAVEPVVRNRIIEDFKQETESVVSRVSDATANFHEIDRLDSVQELPTPVSESVDALMDRARDFRAKLGYETALSECRMETQTTDALSVVDQVTHNLATGNAAEAGTRVKEFLKNNPEPPGESRKNLWDYLASVRSSCSRSEKDADVHLQQAQLFVSAGKIGDAIREYQEAFRIFPTPATAEKIRRLQENSLGL